MRHLLPSLTCLIVGASSFAQTSEDQEKESPAATPRALKVGDLLPPVVLESLSQTQARSFSEFYGRTLLVEFFAHWCQPCALTVPHLNELQAKYGERGLTVLGVTTDGGKKTSAWVEKNGAEYAWGRDATGELHQLFQVQAIPTAALIDPFGAVAWTGDPRRLKEETLESALADALERPVWEWPEEARPLAGMLARVELASALSEAEKQPTRDGFDFPGLVRGRISTLLKRFEDLVVKEEYGKALELGDRLAKGLTPLPEGDGLGARLEELRSNPETMRRVNAEKSIEAFEARAGALRRLADAEKLRTEVSEFKDSKPGEEFERRAKILLDMLDRGLAKTKKKS